MPRPPVAKPPLVCGVDDSPAARSAVAVGARLAARLDAELVLVHVGPDPGLSPPSLAGELAQLRDSVGGTEHELVARAAAEAGVEDYRWRPVQATDAAEGLLASARAEHAELLVVGSRQRGTLATALLGSVSERLARSARCPVVIVPEGSERTVEEVDAHAAPARPLVCGIDGSEGALHAAAVAGELGRRLRRRVLLLTVCQFRAPSETGLELRSPRGVSLDVDALLDSERQAGLVRLSNAALRAGRAAEVETVLEVGDPAERLLERARAEDAELLVVATRGHGPARSALLGSVSQRVARDAGRPVVIVPPPVGEDRGKRDPSA